MRGCSGLDIATLGAPRNGCQRHQLDLRRETGGGVRGATSRHPKLWAGAGTRPPGCELSALMSPDSTATPLPEPADAVGSARGPQLNTPSRGNRRRSGVGSRARCLAHKTSAVSNRPPRVSDPGWAAGAGRAEPEVLRETDRAPIVDAHPEVQLPMAHAARQGRGCLRRVARTRPYRVPQGPHTARSSHPPRAPRLRSRDWRSLPDAHRVRQGADGTGPSDHARTARPGRPHRPAVPSTMRGLFQGA